MFQSALDVGLPRKILTGHAFMAPVQNVHDAAGGIRRVRGFDESHVSRYDFGQRSCAGGDQILADGAGFRGGKSKPFDERRHYDGVDGADVFAQFGIFDPAYPSHPIGYAQGFQFGSDEIGSRLFVS